MESKTNIPASSVICTLILKGQQVSTQHAYGQRGRIRYMKKEAKDLKDAYILQARCWYNWSILEEPLDAIIDLTFYSNARRDWDNWHKLSMDSLEWIVFKDDSQLINVLVRKQEKNKLNPNTTITILKYWTIKNLI